MGDKDLNGADVLLCNKSKKVEDQLVKKKKKMFTARSTKTNQESGRLVCRSGDEGKSRAWYLLSNLKMCLSMAHYIIQIDKFRTTSSIFLWFLLKVPNIMNNEFKGLNVVPILYHVAIYTSSTSSQCSWSSPARANSVGYAPKNSLSSDIQPAGLHRIIPRNGQGVAEQQGPANHNALGTALST